MDPKPTPDEAIATLQARVKKGGAERYHQKNTEAGKLFARVRLERLLDPGSFVEDALEANALDAELPADGVITGLGRIDGRTVAVMANDSTVKAGSWGKRTVEKILRVQETALRLRVPLFYLVDSAGARITDQVEMFPGRRGAGRIFFNEVQLSGLVPQVCLLFGPSAAGGAYIPAFCDIVVMVDGNASMYLGSPRMAEVATTIPEPRRARTLCVSGSSRAAGNPSRRSCRHRPGSHDTVTFGLTCSATQAAACSRLAAAAGVDVDVDVDVDAGVDADADDDVDADPVRRPAPRLPGSAMIGAVAATHTSTPAAPSTSAQRRLRCGSSSRSTRPTIGQDRTRPTAPAAQRCSGRPSPSSKFTPGGCPRPAARS